MATRKLSFLERLANMAGALSRYHAREAPRRIKLLMDIAKKELAPPKPSEWSAIKRDFQTLSAAIRTKAYREYTVREVAVYVGVALELVFVFFFGEMVGRRNVTGYIIPGSYISKDTLKKAKRQEKEAEDKTNF